MSSDVCPSCQAPLPSGAAFCHQCGAALQQKDAQKAPDITQHAGRHCPACGLTGRPGAAFCEACGTPLLPAAVASAASRPAPAKTPTPSPTQPTGQAGQSPAAPTRPAGAGPGSLKGWLVVRDSGAVLPIPEGLRAAILGREDPVSGIFPEIDLQAHGAQEAGVGRQHARLSLQGDQVFIEDLNSVNGTLVNQMRLKPGRPVSLNNGDELLLGRLALVFFTAG